MKRLTKQLMVRVEPDLLLKLERDADANGRTVAQTVRFLLHRSFDRAAATNEETPRG